MATAKQTFGNYVGVGVVAAVTFWTALITWYIHLHAGASSDAVLGLAVLYSIGGAANVLVVYLMARLNERVGNANGEEAVNGVSG